MKLLRTVLSILLMMASFARATYTIGGNPYTTRMPWNVPDSAIPGNITNALIVMKITTGMTNSPDTTIAANTNSDGRDIRVTTSGGTVCEQKKLNWVVGAGPSLTGYLWFTAPLTDGQTNTFYLYYDSSTGISDADDSAAIATTLSIEAWWPMDSGDSPDVIDLSGNSNTLSLFNDAAYSTTVRGTSLYLPGSDDRAEADDPSAFNFTSESFSFSFWMYLEKAANNYIVSNGGASSSGYDLYVTNGRITFFTNQSGTYQSTQGAYSADEFVDRWVYVNVTRNGSSVKMYENGQRSQFNDGTHSDPASASGNDWVLGAFYNGTALETQGYVDDFLIHTRELSADEAAWMSNNQSDACDWFGAEETDAGGPTAPPQIFSGYDDPNEWYQIEIAPRVQEQIGNNNHAMIDALLDGIQYAITQHPLGMTQAQRQQLWVEAERLNDIQK